MTGYINARVVSELGDYGFSGLSDPRLMIGATVFVFAMILNLSPDNILLSPRKS